MTHTILTFLEIQSYYLQNKIYNLFFSQLNHIQVSTFILLSIAGILTSINPCLISILPLSLSQINYRNNNQMQKKMIISGLLSSITGIIIIISLFKKTYYQLTLNIPILSSLLTIFIGLNLLKILDFDIKIAQSQMFTNNTNKYIGSWILGFIIGINSSSCSTPIVATIIIWLSNSNNLLLSIIYMSFYLLGYILPIWLLIYISINYDNINIMTKIWNYIVPTSGSFLIGIGFFSLLEHIFI